MSQQMDAIDRCRLIMRWIHQHPGIRRGNQEIAKDLALPVSSVSKTINRDFPDCFKKLGLIGNSLSGAFPFGVEFDLNEETPSYYPDEFPRYSRKHIRSDDEFLWNPTVLKEMNSLWQGRFEQTVLHTLQNGDKDDAEFIRNIGEHMFTMADRIIKAKVIGTSNQESWRPE